NGRISRDLDAEQEGICPITMSAGVRRVFPRWFVVARVSRPCTLTSFLLPVLSLRGAQRRSNLAGLPRSPSLPRNDNQDDRNIRLSAGARTPFPPRGCVRRGPPRGNSELSPSTLSLCLTINHPLILPPSPT